MITMIMTSWIEIESRDESLKRSKQRIHESNGEVEDKITQT